MFVERDGRIEWEFVHAAGCGRGEAIATLCRRLDGSALTLTLAAARVCAMGVHDLVARLDVRLALLTGGDRTSDAATAVGPPDGRDNAFDTLARLVDRSLVLALHGPDGSVRYRLLERIRAYAADKLEASEGTEDARNRHLRHFGTDRVPSDDPLAGFDLDQEALHVDRENLRAAMEWALASGNRPAALHLAIFLFAYWSWAADPEDTVTEWYRRTLWLPGERRDRCEGVAMAQLAWWSFDPAPLETAHVRAADLDDQAVRSIAHWVSSVILGSSDLAAARLDRGGRGRPAGRRAVQPGGVGAADAGYVLPRLAVPRHGRPGDDPGAGR